MDWKALSPVSWYIVIQLGNPTKKQLRALIERYVVCYDLINFTAFVAFVSR